MKFSNYKIPVREENNPNVELEYTQGYKTSKKYRCRDPFILLYGDKYYFYKGTYSGVVCLVSDDLETWSDPVKVFPLPENFHGIKDNFWAPEVHYYNGYFYLFTSVFSSKTNHRCISVYRADNPLGPFVDIADGCISPKDWDAIDGTLYVDPQGQPWMVFVHEWTSMPDQVGSMVAAKLSEDFTHLISEPIELFKANDRTDREGYRGITDGPYMYTDANGHLMMIWSNVCKGLGYYVAIVHSETDTIEGPWTHQEEFLYRWGLVPGYNDDGGHAMIFEDKNGKTLMALHAPNGIYRNEKGEEIKYEHLHLFPIVEKDGTIVIEQ